MKRILGIDFGAARTGVAASDELRILAHPVETIFSNSSEVIVQRIRDLVAEKEADCVVVGLPRNMNGSLGASAEKAQQFAEKLRSVLPCEVITWDERLTTMAAHRALREGGQKTRDSRGFVDQVAAQMILQGYLDGLQTARDRNPEAEIRPND